jgi:hypothetical protein
VIKVKYTEPGEMMVVEKVVVPAPVTVTMPAAAEDVLDAEEEDAGVPTLLLVLMKMVIAPTGAT